MSEETPAQELDPEELDRRRALLIAIMDEDAEILEVLAQ